MQVGDTVHVRAVVEQVISDSGAIVRVGTNSPIHTFPSQIVHVEPRPIAVGDRVKSRSGYYSNDVAVVVSIDERLAFVKLEKRVGVMSHYILPLSNAERVL